MKLHQISLSEMKWSECLIFYNSLNNTWKKQYLELLSIHGGNFAFFANGEGVGDRLVRGLRGDDKVIAGLLDLGHRFDVLGHFDDILGESWWEKEDSEAALETHHEMYFELKPLGVTGVT